MSEQQAAAQPDLGAIWQRVTETLKERVVMPALWRAMENGQPIALTDDMFVVGYPVQSAYDSHLLTDTRFKNLIEQSLASITGRPTAIRVIQGTTLDDWRQIQEEDRARERLLAERERKEVSQPGDAGWDGVSEQLIRRYAAMPYRQLPAVQAEFLIEAVAEIAAAYSRLMPADASDDAQLRSYSRLLERVADRTAVPAAILGCLVLQHRKAGGASGG